MRSLLHQTTLTITAVLALISCATQTQAVGVKVGGNPDGKLYARNFIEQVAAKEGISIMEWTDGEADTFSFAKVMHGRKPGFMTCIVGNRDKAAFEALVSAQTTLKGANEEYRNYVKDPVKSIPVPAGPSQQAGNCFVYRNVNGDRLWSFIRSRSNYADRLVTLNQVMPQLLKGSIYLYNAGIRHIDLILDYTTVLQQPTGQLKATMFGFDAKAGSQPLPPQQQLDINTSQ
ncbi:hypothetical protein BDF22DRAFT_735055 [Syncephalis plumigaleata]|nr:hypothetical protein BDF22DRAFT_735055 [Syncephalis plumigaleata]